MGKLKKAKSKKKSLSNVKKKNITTYKLGKQGILGKERKKQRRKEKKKNNRKLYLEHKEAMRKKQEEMEKQDELTGEDMMDMIDDDDLNTLLEQNSAKMDIDEIEKKGRVFPQYNLTTKDGREVKESLPVMTEKGWKEKLVVPTNKQSLTLSKFRLRNNTQNKNFGYSGNEEDETLYNNEEEEVQIGGVKSVAQILAERKRFLHSQKVKMGCLALNVVQDPTKGVNMRFLLNMLTNFDPREEITIYKYALHTILQVFHDLIPSYRIQENALKHGRMRKNKYLHARQELDFIVYYKKYLKCLEGVLTAWKEDYDNLGLATVSETVIYCLGDLLVRHPAFNFSINIIQALVPYLSHKNVKIRNLVLDCLSHTIKNDKSCFLSLEVVRRVYKLTHRLRFKVKEEVLRVLLSLRGSEMKNIDQINERERASTNALTHKEKLIKKLTENFRQKPSKKQRREKKKMAKINKQMESINMEEIQNVQNERHSEIIEKVFGLYIHVLKNRTNSKLISVVLEGLAKFAHLVNMEFFSDLLGLMNTFLEEGILGRRESIYCIQTVFTILSGQGEALNIDPHRFYNQFYRLLIELNAKEREENIEAIIDILEQMLVLRRRKVSPAKVLSFIKRIATISLLLPHHLAIPVLVKLKKLFSLFSVSEALLDPDQEGFPGIYLPEISDPEHSNSGATAAWELTLSQRSYQPYVALLSRNILSEVSVREVPALHPIIEKSVSQLREYFDPSKVKFNPAIRDPSSHLTSIKRKATKQLFQNGELDLEDLKLQEICENVLSEETLDNIEEPPRKKVKNESDESLDFYSNFKITDDNNFDEKTESSLKDFTSALVDVT